MIYCNGIFHSNINENDTFCAMEVRRGRIVRVFRTEQEIPENAKKADLGGAHVYPCLLDGHIHLLLTVAVMAMGFSACDFTSSGVEPHTVEGVGARIRAYASEQKPDAVIAVNNYILNAVDEHRMPSREELDAWGGGRAVVVYNIDGHSTALSSRMLEKIGICPDGHSGVLQGEENERAQGRLIDTVGATVGLSALAKGIAELHNRCAEYGIAVLGALEGNGDSEKDATTGLIARLARHFDLPVRLYLQYTDYARVKPFEHMLRRRRVGGCGDWEMDGAVGAHSAAFRLPYQDTGLTAPCYRTQKSADDAVRTFEEKGYQIASHAIGEAAISRILESYEKTGSGTFHRVEHCEFPDEDAVETLRFGKYAVMMQPGYAWIDKRYLHTYEQYLPESILARMKLKTLFDAGVCVCGSSDSPVQDLDPWLQMLGMTQFYVEEESVTAYQAFAAYTKNAARALQEEADYGTLEEGRRADFFISDRNLFRLSPRELVSFRPLATFYGGKPYRKKSGSVAELLAMLLRPAKRI